MRALEERLARLLAVKDEELARVRSEARAERERRAGLEAELRRLEREIQAFR